MELINLTDLIKLCWKNKKTLIYVAIISIIASSVLSFFITPYYKSSTTIYPGKITQAPINETALRRGNIMEFGSTEEAEQTIELLSSTKLQEKIIDKFDLYTHYKIKKGEELSRTFVLKEFQGNVSYKRTKFNSIIISVLDTDPKKAADMANAIASELDSVKMEIVESRAHELLKNLEDQVVIQKLKIDTIAKVVESYKKLGIMSQFERGYLLQAFAESNPSERAKIKPLVDINITKGEDFDRKERELDYELDNLYLLQKYVTQTKADAEFKFIQKFVVDTAIPSEKKESPVRWIIVLASLISALLMAIILIILRNKWPSIQHNYFSE